MKIENIGLGPAYDIRFDIKPDFEMRKDYWLSNIKLLKDGLHYFAPKQSYQFFLTSMLEDYNEKIIKKFEILVSYKNVEGKEFHDIYLIDLSIYSGMIKVGKPPLHDIAERIKEIKDDIHSLVTGDRRIKAIVFTQEDLREELKEIEEQEKLLIELQRSEKGIKD